MAYSLPATSNNQSGNNQDGGNGCPTAGCWYSDFAKLDGQSIYLQLFPSADRFGKVRPVGASAIAGILAKHEHNPLQPDDVTVVTTANIGRATVNDPVTGRRGSVVYSDTSVGVGVGRSGRPPDPAATDRDRAAIQQELEDKSLSEGKATSPVAGYLYFPKPHGKAKNAAVDLTYYGATGQLKLRLPVPVKP